MPCINVAALGEEPQVLLLGEIHALQRATPDAGWVAAPPAADTGTSPGWFIAQSTLDMWAMAAGRVTPFLRASRSVLSLQIRPAFFSSMMDALICLFPARLGSFKKVKKYGKPNQFG